MTYPFKSDADGQYYFWLGDALRGPYDEYTDAHTEMTRLIERANKEKPDDYRRGT